MQEEAHNWPDRRGPAGAKPKTEQRQPNKRGPTRSALLVDNAPVQIGSVRASGRNHSSHLRSTGTRRACRVNSDAILHKRCTMLYERRTVLYERCKRLHQRKTLLYERCTRCTQLCCANAGLCCTNAVQCCMNAVLCCMTAVLCCTITLTYYAARMLCCARCNYTM